MGDVKSVKEMKSSRRH